MMQESAKVLVVENGWASVETLRVSACHTCAMKSGCGQSLMQQLVGGRQQWKVRLSGVDVQVRSGDHVVLQLPEQTLLQAAAWLYGLPLLLLLAGGVVGFMLGQGADVYAIAGSFAGLLLAVVLLRWHGRRNANNPYYQPTIKQVCATAPANDLIASDCRL